MRHYAAFDERYAIVFIADDSCRHFSPELRATPPTLAFHIASATPLEAQLAPLAAPPSITPYTPPYAKSYRHVIATMLLLLSYADAVLAIELVADCRLR